MVGLPRKAACTSLKYGLLRALGHVDGPVHERQRPEWREIGVEDTPEDAEYIGVLREPMARLWSAFMEERGKNGRHPPEHFPVFIRELAAQPDAERNVHAASQASYLRTPSGRLPSSWLYVECLPVDWLALCVRKGWPVKALPCENASGAPCPIELIDHSTQRLIETAWAEDCELYESQWSRREAVLARQGAA